VDGRFPNTRMNPVSLFHAGWDTYYIIIGSSAGALIGLQFIVMALIASTPWPSLWAVQAVLGLFGVLGLVYCGIVVRRIRRQTGYQIVLEDRIWYAVIPFIAYGSLIAAALLLRDHTQAALFTTAGATLLLLCIGLHNSWDTITYVAIDMRPPKS
jgi:hypothetical protein